ncbi:hypothetical protein [Brumimicrobium aurantiacum]|uniref:DUF2116 family Zn-ribbon domain-containing protein n=1 Tax=Brumimicrobium aurantiacum TaxID=1737063 RepID=A0A3E1EXE4_9FLAO|nr:hypothetical protein [Brumimicrobium aurantiacum]RFC54231.1 hypothetical protein DXU93_09605 [Brumimicrobium aurantiacum]
MNTKICPSCSKEFQGRRNKKYCSVSCKNQYHNEEYRNSNQTVITLNRTLQKNRVILKDLFKVYRSSAIPLSVLEAHGFDKKFHTHLFNAPSGDRYTMVYELGYKTSFDNQIQIVEMDEVV